MSIDYVQLGRRALDCKGWRWMPGMRLECGDILLWSDDQHWHCCDDNQNWIRWRHDRIGQAERGSLPDLTDPATLGCLLALVREAWDQPGLHVRLEPDRWRAWTDEPGAFVYHTEAEALVCLLGSAP